MHPNQVFRKAETGENIAFARTRSFGTLAINADGGPLLSHIPFYLSEDGTCLEAHLVRSNPIVRALEGDQLAVMSITGPDAYISPDWYGIEDQVPTWNYVAVHLRGTLRKLPQDRLRGIVERLSDTMETRLLPKPIWALDKIDEDSISKLFKMIVPVAMDVTRIDGTWKLGQNRPDEAREAAANAVEGSSIGSQTAEIARFMRNPPR